MAAPTKTCLVALAVVIAVPLSLCSPSFGSRADFDGDTDVDHDDFSMFMSCFSGPNGPGNPSCWDPFLLAPDFDMDGDVDLDDYGFMQGSFGGEGAPAPFEPEVDPSALVAFDLAGALEVQPGTPLAWSARVSVTGDNQGLASYVFALTLHAGGPQGPLVWQEIAVPTDPNGIPIYTPSFNFFGMGPAGVNEPPLEGGPGMGVVQPVFSEPGMAIGIGAAYGPWEGQPGMMGGVGLGGGDVVNNGWIDTTNLTPGATYTLELSPGYGINVLRPDVDLDYPQGAFAMVAGSVAGDSLTFTVLPEPATFALVALGGLSLLRRRRH